MAMKTPAELKEFVKVYCRSRGWMDDDLNVEEVLLYGDTVYTRVDGEHRWWNDVFRVIDIDGTLIGCYGAQTTGDNSPRDVGWQFDWNSLCEVERREVVTMVYERAEQSQ
jgi:hypothetical protein